MKADKVIEQGNKVKSIIIWTAVGVALIVGAAFGIKFLLKGRKERLEEKADIKEASKQIVNKELTFNESEYSAKADLLEGAMSGMGTDWDTLTGVIYSLKTKSDWYKVNAKFGTRDKQNLVQWMIDDLDGSEMKQIRDYLKKIGVSV